MTELPIDRILEVAMRYGFTNLRVFGSRARGDASPESDLDLLAEFPPETSLLDVIGFEQDLEELLGIPVQVLRERALHPVIKDEVLAEAKPLVAA